MEARSDQGVTGTELSHMYRDACLITDPLRDEMKQLLRQATDRVSARLREYIEAGWQQRCDEEGCGAFFAAVKLVRPPWFPLEWEWDPVAPTDAVDRILW